VDEKTERYQLEKLTKYKSNRDEKALKKALEHIRQTAIKQGEIFETFIDAIKVKASLGEIVGVLKDVFGEYKENVVL